jgi:DNA-binding winged helix-turn-helix (wHTH) protein
LIFLFGDCELDTGAFELRCCGVACAIEPQVLELLLYLVTNRGRLVGKEELHAAVWRGRVVSDAALSSRVKAVRRAIGDGAPGQGRIRTVFGRGFRFEGDVSVRESSPGLDPDRQDLKAAPAEFHRRYLCGHFACYSRAWSPAFEGLLVRGSLSVEAALDRPESLKAVYAESLSSGVLRHSGEVAFSGQTMYLDLVDGGSGSRALLALLCPSPPGSALLGAMCGKVFHDPNSEIAASRILAVRVPAEQSATLDGGNRYIECTGGALRDDLRAAGLSLPPGAALGSLLARFLSSGRGAGFFRISADENARVNVGLDKALTEAAQIGGVRAKRGRTRAHE